MFETENENPSQFEGGIILMSLTNDIPWDEWKLDEGRRENKAIRIAAGHFSEHVVRKMTLELDQQTRREMDFFCGTHDEEVRPEWASCFQVFSAALRTIITVNKLRFNRSVAKCCNRKGIENSVDLNEDCDILPRLITIFTHQETPDIFYEAQGACELLRPIDKKTSRKTNVGTCVS